MLSWMLTQYPPSLDSNIDFGSSLSALIFFPGSLTLKGDHVLHYVERSVVGNTNRGILFMTKKAMPH